jgi:hypothetical protein
LGVDCNPRVADSSDDNLKGRFDDMWWQVDGFGCAVLSLGASTVWPVEVRKDSGAQKQLLRGYWLLRVINYLRNTSSRPIMYYAD